jgi:hypothetical protein
MLAARYKDAFIINLMPTASQYGLQRMTVVTVMWISAVQTCLQGKEGLMELLQMLKESDVKVALVTRNTTSR